MLAQLLKNAAYWLKRRKAEKQYQLDQLADINAYNKHIADLYTNAASDLDNEIQADLMNMNQPGWTKQAYHKFASRARGLVSRMRDMFKNDKAGYAKVIQHIGPRLKAYNATMRINRAETIKALCGERVTELGADQNASMHNKLESEYIKETQRESGILGVTTKNPSSTSPKTIKSVDAQINGADFSDRIWANMDVLKGKLDGAVSSGIIRGDNPVETARKVRDQVTPDVANAKYASERIARTETARVQADAAKDSVKSAGLEYMQWIAEPSACDDCQQIADNDMGFGKGVYPIDQVPDLPAHPNCRCSLAPYWVDDD